MCLAAVICESPLKSNSHNTTINNENCLQQQIVTLHKMGLVAVICESPLKSNSHK